MIFNEVRYQDIKHFKSRASKEGSSVTDTPHTQWFSNDDKSCCFGVLFMRSGGCRLKGVFVNKVNRGKSIGSHIIEYAIQHAKTKNRSFVEAITYNPNYYINKFHFKQTSAMTPNGAVRVTKPL